MKMIVAMDQQGLIGLNGSIPWECKPDLLHFARLTRRGAVIMGRKTFESLPNGPLSGRLNIIVSPSLLATFPKDVEYCCECGLKQPDNTSPREKWIQYDFAGDKYCIVGSVRDAVATARRNDYEDDEIWFIGGAGIYKEAFKMCDQMWITRVCCTVKYTKGVDEPVFFPIKKNKFVVGQKPNISVWPDGNWTMWCKDQTHNPTSAHVPSLDTTVPVKFRMYMRNKP